jgi:hypothetical protein
MRKLPAPVMDQTPPTWKKTRRKIVALLLGLLFAPLIYEGSKVCVMQWRAMSMMPPGHVKTPLLDRLGAEYEVAALSASSAVYAFFHRVPWRPIVVIPFACAWALCSGALLRKW